MVNLAKLRKKAKEKKDELLGTAPVSAEEPAEPAVPKEPPPPKKAAKAKKQPAAGEVPKPDQVSSATATATENLGEVESAGVSRDATRAEDRRAEGKLEAFRATAGTRRAAFDATETVEAAAGNGQIELLTFVMAGEQYAIDIERIAEIISPRKPTAVPNAPPAVVGIISLRGTIVTMLDLRRELGHQSSYTAGPETRAIVVEDRGGLAGFVVDRVLRVVKVSPEDIQSHPVVSPAEQRDAIRGVFRHGSTLTVVLEIEKLLGASN